jgi:hypothetical protein
MTDDETHSDGPTLTPSTPPDLVGWSRDRVKELSADAPTHFHSLTGPKGVPAVKCGAGHEQESPDVVAGSLRTPEGEDEVPPRAAVLVVECVFPDLHPDRSKVRGTLTLAPASDPTDRAVFERLEPEALLQPLPLTDAEAKLPEIASDAASRTADATKWVVASAGGVAAVLLAGLQLGAVSGVSRWWQVGALVLAGLALLAVGAALWYSASVLAPRTFPMGRLVSERQTYGARAGRKLLGDEAKRRLVDRNSKELIGRLLDTHAYWNRIADKSTDQALTDAKANLENVYARLAVAVAEAEYISVGSRFKRSLYALAIAGALVFAASCLVIVAKGHEENFTAAKDDAPVTVTLTSDGADNVSREIGHGCLLAANGPEQATLVGGSPLHDPEVVFGQPDSCATRSEVITPRDGTVVPASADPSRGAAVVSPTRVRVIFLAHDMARVRTLIACALPAIKGRFMYEGTATFGNWGGEIEVVLQVPNSRACDGRTIMVGRDLGSVVPL